MATLREYCEKLSDAQLEEILIQDFNNEVSYPVDTILMVCEILARRNPGGKDAKVAYQEFIEQYLPFLSE